VRSLSGKELEDKLIALGLTKDKLREVAELRNFAYPVSIESDFIT